MSEIRPLVLESNSYSPDGVALDPTGFREIALDETFPVENIPQLPANKVEGLDVVINSQLVTIQNDLDTAESDINALESGLSSLNSTVNAHNSNTSNPHSVTKSQVGLGNVDNTSDTNKPVSSAQQTALDAKINVTDSVNNLTTTASGKVLDARQGKALKDLIDALNALVGGTTPDGNSVTDTVAEVLAVMATYPEGVDLLTTLNSKVNFSDVVNTLTEIGSGKVLDGRQGKALKDLYDAISVSLTSHSSNTSNPHSVTKAQVGLGNADNTSDVNKPVSTAQQTALDAKVNTADVANNLTTTASGKVLDARQGKVLKDAIDAINAIIGGATADGDSLVNTVAELLAVFQNFAEGLDIATLFSNIGTDISALQASLADKQKLTISGGNSLPMTSTRGEDYLFLNGRRFNSYADNYWQEYMFAPTAGSTAGDRIARNLANTAFEYLSGKCLDITGVAGTGGVTANKLVKYASDGTIIAVTGNEGILGIAQATASVGADIRVKTFGLAQGVAEGAVTAGNYLIAGTTDPTCCKDSGQSSLANIPTTTRIIGKAIASAADGATFNLEIFGAYRFGAAVDINGLTEDTAPDTANDFVMTWDASAGTNKKVKLTNLGAGGGGGSNTPADNVFLILDNSDNTKKIAFEASGISTGTTRTFTAPNLSGTLAVIDQAQTFSAAQTFSSQIINSLNSALSTPAVTLTGTWINTGGTATTTKPHFLIEPTSTTSTGWSTSGTGLGVNSASGFGGNLIDLQVGGVSKFKITSAGQIVMASSIDASNNGSLTVGSAGTIAWNTRARMESAGANQITLLNASSNNFIALNFGGTTNSYNAFIRDAVNGFSIQSAAGSSTFNDNSTAASGTVANRYIFGIAAPTLSSTNATVTYTVASTLYLGGAPSAGSNVTIGSAYVLTIAAGNISLGSGVNFVLDTTTGTKIGTSSSQKLGFFGVSPAIQQTGGAATASGSYTATEQSMLQTVYNCLRTFGLLS